MSYSPNNNKAGVWCSVMSLLLRLCVIMPLLLIGQSWGEELVAIPALNGRVVDLTETLSVGEKKQLSLQLQQIERNKGAQVVILMLPTVQPETIENFGIRLADTWKIGRQGVEDGLIIIVAKKDRRVRFEVGYALEGAVGDAVASRIISQSILPAFKQNDYYGGLQLAVRDLTQLINGETLPPPNTNRVEKTLGQWDIGMVLPLAFMVMVLGRIFSSFLGRVVTAVLVAVMVLAVTWMLTALWWLAILMAVVIFIWALSFYGSTSSVFAQGRNYPSSPRSWNFPTSSGGFGGGNSGGFSGGGGKFGGGGASGQW